MLPIFISLLLFFKSKLKHSNKKRKKGNSSLNGVKNEKIVKMRKKWGKKEEIVKRRKKLTLIDKYFIKKMDIEIFSREIKRG